MNNIQPYIDLIHSQINPAQPLYLLVDPLETVDEDEPFSLESLENALGKEHIATVPRADLIHTSPDCPHLALLANAGASLSSTATSALPANTRIYPVYEPLRQELIAYACSEASSEAHNENSPHTHSQWLGPISQWIIPASNQGFLCFKAEPVPSSQATPAALPQNAVNAQIDIALAADVLRTWHYLCTQPLSAQQQQQMPLLARSNYTLPQGAIYMALQQLYAAHRRGLTSAKDRQLFAIMRLTMHPHIEQHPIVREKLTLPSAKHCPLLSK